MAQTWAPIGYKNKLEDYQEKGFSLLQTAISAVKDSLPLSNRETPPTSYKVARLVQIEYLLANNLTKDVEIEEHCKLLKEFHGFFNKVNFVIVS